MAHNEMNFKIWSNHKNQRLMFVDTIVETSFSSSYR